MFAEVACVVVAALPLPLVASGTARTEVLAQRAPEQAHDWESEQVFFRSTLAAFRSGDETQAAALNECAERWASQRPDLMEIARFYSGLDSLERKAGWERETRFNAIFESVRLLRAQRLTTQEWQSERIEYLRRLDEIVRESRAAPDFSPAARALALRSTLMRQRIIDDAEMDESTRMEWARTGTREAVEALSLFGRTGLLTPRLEALLSLAWFDWSRGDWSAAQEQFEQVLTLAERLDQPRYREWALTGLLRIAHESGDLREIARLLEAIAQLKSPASSWDLASRHGSLLLALDEPERALEFLSRNKPTDAGSVRDWHVLMQAGLTRKGDAEAALAHESVLREFSGLDPLAKLAVAEARVLRGEFQLAIVELETEIWAERPSVAQRLSRERLLGTALLNVGRRAEAIHTFERALALGDSIESRLSGSDRLSPTASISGEVVGLETMALLARARIENGEPLRAAVAIEDRQSRAMRCAVSNSDEVFVDEAAVRAWAGSFEAGLVTWVVGGDTTVVVHVARDGSSRGAVIQLGRKSIEDAVRRLREAATADDETLAFEYGADLQRALIPAEIGQYIETSAGRLLLCAHGPLEKLPFDLFPLFETRRDRQLVPLVLPGLVASSPGIGLTEHAQLAWSLLGDPIDAHGASRLPGVRAELAELAGLHDGELPRCAASFDRAAVSEALNSNRALHIATHLTSHQPSTASSESSVSNSALELSNGVYFDRDDVLRAQPGLPLVVLSACESGGGDFVDGEAAIGIAKAFLESGTRNLLVTSWAVEDQAARRFSVAFHRALKSGVLPSRAVVSARDTLRAAGAPMSDWAAFRLLGRD